VTLLQVSTLTRCRGGNIHKATKLSRAGA